MSKPFRSVDHIPPVFWHYARRIAEGEEVVRVNCGSMQQAQALKARWYHARRIVGTHIAKTPEQAGQFETMKHITASVEGVYCTLHRAVGKLTLEELLYREEVNMSEEEKALAYAMSGLPPRNEREREELYDRVDEGYVPPTKAQEEVVGEVMSTPTLGYPKTQDAIMEAWLKQEREKKATPPAPTEGEKT